MNQPVKYEPNKFTFNKVINYFFKGLLIVAPISITIYVIVLAINWIDGIIPAFKIPGLGLIIILTSITVIGYITSNFISRSLFEYFEKWVLKIPLISLIYSSLKELIAAFVGDKKKFNRPVIATMDFNNGIQRLGFITQDDLANLGLENKVAVYFPHSYNFSGNFLILPKVNVTPLDVSNTHFMKFIVSGGATGIPNAAFKSSE